MVENKVILITDATHFVGKPGSKALLGEGAVVYVQDPDFTDAAVVKAFSEEIPGARILEVQGAEAGVNQIMEEQGRLDVLISNDSYPALKATIDEFEMDDLRATMDALVIKAFEYARAASKVMKKAGQGKIIFVSSAAPKHGLPNYSMYVAARGAVNSLAVSLCKELGKFNIQVNSLAPNFVESPTYFPKELIENEEILAKITKPIPLGRLGKPHEAGDYLVFLASDKSDFITGQVLYFSGGWA